MAIMASKGAVLAVEAGVLVEAAEVRSVIEVEERRSVAEAKRAPPVLEEEDWICEDAYILIQAYLAMIHPALPIRFLSQKKRDADSLTSAQRRAIHNCQAQSGGLCSHP